MIKNVLWLGLCARRPPERAAALMKVRGRQPRNGEGRFRHLWIIALLAPMLTACVTFQAGSGGTGTGSGDYVSALDLFVGACFNDEQDRMTAQGIDRVELASCTVAHDNEVYAIILVPGAKAEPFPGNKAMVEAADRECPGAFEPYVDINYEDSRFLWAPIMPTEQSWTKDDDREVVCALYDADFEATVGTAKGRRE